MSRVSSRVSSHSRLGDVVEHSARRVGDVRRMHGPAGEVPQQPRVDRPEEQVAPLRPGLTGRCVVEYPPDLGRGEVRVDAQAGLLPDMGPHPLALQRIADGGRPAALPHDRIGDRLPRIPVPDQRRLTLVRNAYRLDLPWGHSRLPQHLINDVQARVEYLPRGVLDPAGRRVYLGDLPADPSQDCAETVQEQRRRPRCALIDSEDMAGLCHRLSPSSLPYTSTYTNSP